MLHINDYINNDIKAFPTTEPVLEIQDFFAETHFSHFPILEDGVYIGSINREDAETFESNKTINDFRYTLEPFFVRTSMIWIDVLEIFAKNNANLVPILDDENVYSGYYELHDIIKFFNETPFLKEPGGIIIVEKAVTDYSMGQISQIVESNNGKILGVFISGSTASTVQVTIKVTLGSLNEILQTFRRYEYIIVSDHHEDNYIKNLKERSDYLDKYLNM